MNIQKNCQEQLSNWRLIRSQIEHIVICYVVDEKINVTGHSRMRVTLMFVINWGSDSRMISNPSAMLTVTEHFPPGLHHFRNQQ